MSNWDSHGCFLFWTVGRLLAVAMLLKAAPTDDLFIKVSFFCLI